MNHEWKQHWLGGTWAVASDPDAYYDVVNPSTEEIAGRVPHASVDDALAALSAARRAQESWGSSDVKERAAILRAIAAGIRDRADELAALITAEVGTPVSMSKALQVDLSAVFFDDAAALVEEFAFEYSTGSTDVVLEPAGVVAAIVPWNFPLHQAATKLAYALAAGCTIVVKASPVAPLALFALAEVMDEAGLPDGVVSVIAADGRTAGEAMVSSPDTGLVSFTGSTGAGRRVAALAAERVIPAALELGGKSASIVLNDLEPDAYAKAVKRTVSDCMLNAGQRCIALSRLLVPRTRLREAEQAATSALARWIIGDPTSAATTVGPMVSEVQRDSVTRHVDGAIREGARVAAQGSADMPGRGFFVQPVILSDVTIDMAVATEEVFGPVLVILAFDDEDDAVAVANSTPYGLSGAIWSSDAEHAKAVARRVRTGQISINGGVFDPKAPFGGRGDSGYGRECGASGLEEFLVTKALLNVCS
ncbi:aldehyde dehydrogenase family protein [Rhodococcus sp. NPDC127530]|uniref:aldehyde dehydrogenase family protein n=1 Tax=unclassified Rhodococcus (in: high G+C Gram-positive bacteria) TaxID=192944 RepID=UPI003626CB7F